VKSFLKVLSQASIRSALYELAALVDVPVEDLKEEFEKTVQAISGRSPTFLEFDNEQNLRLQTLSLEKMYRAYKKTLQFNKLLNKEAVEPTKEKKEIIVEKEADGEDEVDKGNDEDESEGKDTEYDAEDEDEK
jgi:hypothetical protein